MISGLLVAAAGAGCLSLSACTKKSKAAASTAASKAAPAQRVLYPATDYYEQSPGRAGGTLKVSVATDTGNLDMHAISATNAQWLGRLIFDSLVYLDDKGEPTPWLAKSWEISADGKTYTFHLRDDVTFSDGAKFNAEAVRVNLEHMRDPATKSPLAAAYIAPYVNGEIVDEYTFRAHLREAYAPFLNVLAQSWLAMESPKALTENPKGFAAAPVGSGPFLVESYTRQQGIKLVRRADYHWAPEFIRHRGPAWLERIELDFVQEALVRFSSLGAGQHDLTTDAPPQNAAAIRADSRLAVDSRIRQGNPSRVLAFNTEKFPFDDVRVRKAIALAMDREGITRVTGFGEFQGKADFLAANTRYYDPTYKDALNQDIPAANRLLDEAGWTGHDAEGIRTNKEGKRLAAEVLLNNSQTPSLVVVALQSDVKKIGVELKIVQRPAPELADRRRSGDYQALGAGVWHTNTPDGLYIVYDSHEITSEKRVGQNVSRLSDPELDQVLSAARASQSDTERRRLYSEAQKRLTELVPAIPLHENYTLTARKSDVKGVVYDTSHNTIVFTTVWLDR